MPAWTQAQDASNDSVILAAAENLMNSQRYSEALELFISLVNSVDPEIKIKALRISAQIHMIEGESGPAIEKLNEALTLSRTIFNQHEETLSLYHLARAYSENNSFNLGRKHAEDAALLSQLLGDRELEYRIRNFLVYTYFMTETDFYKTLSQETQLFHLVNTVGSEQQKAAVYNNLGYDLTVAGSVHVDSTMSLMNFANAHYAKMEQNNGRWYTLMNLTWQYRLKYELDSSLKYGKMALSQALIEEDRHAVVETAFQLGETLMEIGNMDSAARQYQIGKSWRDETDDRDGYVFDIYYSKFLWNSGQRKEAIMLLEEAVDWLKRSEVFYEMHGRSLLATYYLENGQIEAAKQLLTVLHNPRHNYISLETRCILAITNAKILKKSGRNKLAESLLSSWLNHTRELGFKQLELLIEAAQSDN